MTTFEAKKDEPLSNACLNIMFTPQPYLTLRQVCTSSLSDNTCLISFPNSNTCTKYCTSYPGMECQNAYYPNNWGSCNPDDSREASCDNPVTTYDTVLCQCSFIPGASQQSNQILSLFPSSYAPNSLPYCPAYPSNTFTDDDIMTFTTKRRLDAWQDQYQYGRSYKKVTLTIDYNAAKADGSAQVVNAETRWDTNDWSTDSYITGTPEMCTGVVSRIRPGDPTSKCSFGNRPRGVASNSCYGKLYAMTYDEASNKCATRGGRLAKIDSVAKFQLVSSLYSNDYELSIGLKDQSGGDWRWDGSPNVKFSPSSVFNSSLFRINSWYDDCTRIIFFQNNVRNPYLTTAACSDKRTYLCESIPKDATYGGDLLADEGGFCVWYYQNPVLALPDDQSGNFRNTELAYFNLYDPSLSSSKYLLINDELLPINDIPGQPFNKINFDSLTGRKFGRNSDSKIIPNYEYNSSFHCHFTPTNFGMTRIYNNQHMLQRLYTGSASQHCFCGYKNLGYLFDRCDCTRSGEQDNNCLTEQGKMLYEETYAQTKEYVRCNNCNNASP